MSSRLGFDDIRLRRTASSFRLATNDEYAGNIRMHAFGKMLSPADDGIPGLATVAFRTTESRKWLPPEAISAVNDILDDRSLIDKAFFPKLTALREASSGAAIVRQALESALGFVFAEFMERFIGSIAFFLSVAARVAASTGCDGVVAVVEVSIFRIYCDGPEQEQKEESSRIVEGFEKVEPDGAGGEDVTRCSICFENLIAGAAPMRLPCSHVLHEGCIAKWLRDESTCPLCRSEVAQPPAKRRRLD